MASGLTTRPTHDLDFFGAPDDGRAEARDFADVYVLAQRFGRPTLLERAREVDPGFDPGVLAQTLRTLDRFVDDEIPIDADEILRVRAFFRSWADELHGQLAPTNRAPIRVRVSCRCGGRGVRARPRGRRARSMRLLALHPLNLALDKYIS